MQTTINRHIKTRGLFVLLVFFSMLIYGIVKYESKWSEFKIPVLDSILGPLEYLPLAFIGLPVATVGLLIDVVYLAIIKNFHYKKLFINLIYIITFFLTIITLFSIN